MRNAWMRSVTDFWDHDFVDKIGLMHPGLWFGLSNGSDEPELDHNMLPQGELKMHFAGGVSLTCSTLLVGRLGNKCPKIISKKAAPRNAAEQHLAGRHQSSKMEDLGRDSGGAAKWCWRRPCGRNVGWGGAMHRH